MVSLKIDRGLDIPIAGKPSGEVQSLPIRAGLFGCDLKPFSSMLKLKLLKKPGDRVQIGEPLVADKDHSERVFISPASGTVKEVIRGLKRRIETVVIEKDDQEESLALERVSVDSSSREELIQRMSEAGLFAKVRRRPFNVLACSHEEPKQIFVQAVEKAPFVPSPHLQIQGYEESWKRGLNALKKLTSGHVHVVHAHGEKWESVEGVKLHTVSGPYPASNPSVHIHHIAPIQSAEDITWTLRAADVVTLGEALEGRFHLRRIIGIGGEGFHEERRGFYAVRVGQSLADIMANRNSEEEIRLISGDVLNGTEETAKGFLGTDHYCISALKENEHREMFHFFRLGWKKFSASKVYLSGVAKTKKSFSFTTSQHGEERAFVDGAVYDRFMPMRLPTMLLVKAMIARDFESAEQLGLLEVAPEDFALPTFVCPSKIEMATIMEQGIEDYAKEVLG